MRGGKGRSSATVMPVMLPSPQTGSTGEACCSPTYTSAQLKGHEQSLTPGKKLDFSSPATKHVEPLAENSQSTSDLESTPSETSSDDSSAFDRVLSVGARTFWLFSPGNIELFSFEKPTLQTKIGVTLTSFSQREGRCKELPPCVIDIVEPHSLAEAAGLRVGMQVLFLGRSPVRSASQASNLLKTARGGSMIEFTVNVPRREHCDAPAPTPPLLAEAETPLDVSDAIAIAMAASLMSPDLPTSRTSRESSRERRKSPSDLSKSPSSAKVAPIVASAQPLPVW